MKKLKLALPKGSLQEATLKLFKKAGIEFRGESRSYLLFSSDKEIEAMLIRAQEIPVYVEKGVFDAGITGKDWILERGVKIKEIKDLGYSKAGLGGVRLVIAVPEDSPIKRVKDLEGKRISTEFVNLTQKYLRQKGVKSEVEFSWGATEVKAGRLVEAIVELTESGSTLSAHNLRVLETIVTSTTKLVANFSSFQNLWKKKKMEDISILLEGALLAEGMVGLKMNLSGKNKKRILSILPAMRRPTISPLSEPDWYAIEIICEEEDVKNLIPKLKRAGAEGIVEYPLNKVIY